MLGFICKHYFGKILQHVSKSHLFCLRLETGACFTGPSVLGISGYLVHMCFPFFLSLNDYMHSSPMLPLSFG